MARALNAADSGVGDHLVAGADIEGSQRQRQRIRAGSDANRPIGMTGGGELSLERLELGAEDEPAAHDDALDRLTDGRRIRTRPQIKERNHIVPTYCGRCSR